ncbi:MAG: hypothetical protein WD379_08970 [Dehalococcoidia bacterium]
MDLQLYLRVLWRFRLIVLLGLVLAFALAFLSYVRVSFDDGAPTFSYRDAQLWRSRATLWATRRDFAAGELILEDETQLTGSFGGLASLYTTLVTSDEVLEILRKDGPVNGFVEVKTAVALDKRSPLPFIAIEAFSPSPRDAVSLAGREINAILEYHERQLDEAEVPPNRRIVLKVLASPRPPELVADRSFTRPAVVFVTALIAVIGFVFILENLRPRRVRRVAPETDVTSVRDTARRSA